MVSIPARCTRCGFTFQPRGGISISNSTDVTFSGNTTNCPRCGGVARFIDGTFDVVDEAIRMKSGPSWSWTVVETLRLGLREIQDQRPDDPVAAVEAINPRVGGLLRKATKGWTRDQIFGLIAMLLAALTWAGATPKDVGKWIGDVEHHLVDLIKEAGQSGPDALGF